MIPIAALLLLVGFLLAVCLLKEINFLEAVAFTIILAGISVFWLTTNIALIVPIYIDRWLITGVGTILLLICAWPAYRTLRHNWTVLKPTGGQWLVLLFALLTVGFGYFYYNNSELLLSIVSYLTRGEAKCFEMQTFKFFGPLNTGNGPEAICEMFKIISTPGNAIFTANSMPIFGVHGFFVLYLCLLVLIYLFVFLFIHRWTGRYWISIVIALFAALNPYVLFTEVLDRNIFVYVLSGALLYSVIFFRDRVLFHGFLFGVVAGMGLRFLPLTFVVPVMLIYLQDKALLSRAARFFPVAAVVAAFNVPHLAHHGFHSLGETEPFWRLLISAFTQLERTPFIPFPNSFFYPLSVLSFFGAAFCAVALYGFYVMIRKDRWLGIAMILMILPTYLVLASQPNWIEGDKARIFLEVLFPIMVAGGFGLDSLFKDGGVLKKIAAIVVIGLALFFIPKGIERINFPLDTDFYKNKPIYQAENSEYYRLLKEYTLKVGVFPNYTRLYSKTELMGKKRSEIALRNRLFGQNAFKKVAENAWVKRNIPVKQKTEFTGLKSDFVSVKIDFSKLAASMKNAVTRVDEKENIFVNFEKEKDLLDIYYKQFEVSWQQKILPVTVLPDVEYMKTTGDIFVDINSFISFGKDEVGFVRVNQINYFEQPARYNYAFSNGMTALPQTDDLPNILLRVPTGVRIILRNWIVNGANGTPHRVDSWVMDISDQGAPAVSFYPWEPESYL